MIWTLRTSSSSILGKVLYTAKVEDTTRVETVGRTLILRTSSSSVLSILTFPSFSASKASSSLIRAGSLLLVKASNTRAKRRY